ncbi:hypothetical protein CICLE_v10024290mg [Citrus x clementina]|uniref:Uncharacterized protein n=1 Tax=Citrus clementina TaxID=85681 RepID=V4TS45_CITCL|nr:hypothetical protein CICLE_v10024290mg [Citrus x clementina]
MPGTGVRQRLQPPLPPEYFGNAAQGEFVFMKARDQVEKRDEKIKKSLESWRKKTLRSYIAWGSLLLKKNACLISSSPRLNVCGNDFGWGRPAVAKITQFARVEAGSVNVEACF